MIKEKSKIYGVFSSGRCLYIGQTLDICRRGYIHKKNNAFPKNARIAVLTETPFEIAGKVESALIKSFQILGQCKMNKRDNEFSYSRIGRCIYSKKLNKYFPSQNAAARYFRVSSSTIKNIMTNKYKIINTFMAPYSDLVEIKVNANE